MELLQASRDELYFDISSRRRVVRKMATNDFKHFTIEQDSKIVETVDGERPSKLTPVFWRFLSRIRGRSKSSLQPKIARYGDHSADSQKAFPFRSLSPIGALKKM